MYFDELDLHDDVLDALWDMHFDECTPIQEQCIPHIVNNRDVIGIAQTGTGKTAAYLLPLLTLLRREPHAADAVNCLIMAPTRELARQIDQALQGFSYYMNINGVAVYGGNDGSRYEQERRSLTSGADIVIATPGRLITHLQLGTLDLSRTTHLVLDEADRMLDMGFSEDILSIVSAMPKERQTILFSATMPDKISNLVKSIMRDPIEVRIAVSKPAEGIDQCVYLVRDIDKLRLVKDLFKGMNPERVIVFAGSKQKVKDLHIALSRAGYNAAAMHSDLDQPQRDDVMNRFKARQIDILVATDIVARGIDIDDITLVVNFDCPRDAEDYVHRIGRTARAGREGRAITLVGERDTVSLRGIEALLEAEVPRGELPEGYQALELGASSRRSSGLRGGNRSNSQKSLQKHKSRKPSSRKNAAKAEVQDNAPAREATDVQKKKRRNHRGGKGRRKPTAATADKPQEGGANSAQ